MTGSGFDIRLDEVTLASAKRGDMRACEKIYRSYHAPAYTLAISSLRKQPRHDAVELEDLIAQVDNELSFTPDSIDLWGQRVNLLLDLAQIYQQQWQIHYGRMVAPGYGQEQ